MSNTSTDMTTIVTTTYYGPTETRGSRIKVATREGARFIPFDHSGRNGIVEEGLARTIERLLTNEHVDITVTALQQTSGPNEDATYWIVTYDLTWKD